MFPCLGPNWPISALSSDSSANANCTYTVLSCFIISPTRYLYFLELMHSFPNPVLDVVWAACKPIPHCSHRRLHLCSRWTCYYVDVRSANSKPELSQLLFISVRQRELVRVLASLVYLLIHNLLGLCT